MKYLTWIILSFFSAFSLYGQVTPERQKQVLNIIERYEQVFLRNPEDPELALAIGEAYYFLGRREEAIPYYLLVLEHQPDNYRVETRLGISYLSIDNFEESERFLRKAIIADPRNPDILAGLGQIKSEYGEDEKAIEYFQRALRYDPNNILALSYLGGIYSKQRRYDQAKELYEKLQVLQPDARWIDEAVLRLEFAKEIDKINQLIIEGEVEQAKAVHDNAILTHFEMSYFYNFPDRVMMRAEMLTEQGKEADAIAMYEKLLSIFPYFNSAYYYLGNLYISKGEKDKAIELYANASQLFPIQPHYRLWLGRLYLENEKFEKAEHQFQEVLQLNPLDYRAYEGLAIIQQNTDDLDLAEKYYKESLAINPNYLPALNNYGVLLLEQNRFAEAKDVYRKIYKRFDDEALAESPWIEANYVRAKIGPKIKIINTFIEEGEIESAIKEYETLLEEHPNSINLYAGLAELYIAEEEFTNALEVYFDALNVEPDNIYIQSQMGFLYLQMANLTKAEEKFVKILQSDPKHADALTGLGRVEEVYGNLSEAESYYMRSLKADPRSLRALSLRASMLMENREYEEAKEMYTRILQINPDASWAEDGWYDAAHAPLLETAEEFIEKGETQKAINIYLKLIDLHPERIRYYFALGQLYTDVEEYQKALGVYQAAFELDPNNVDVQIQLGFAYLNIKNFASADRIFNQILQRDPRNESALAGIGRIHELHKNLDAAEDYYRQALEINPGHIRSLALYGGLLFEKKAYEESMAMYARILKIIPTATWAKSGFYNAKYGPMVDEAESLKERGREYEAARTYLTLIDLRPEHIGYYFSLGQLYREMKEYRKAICILRKALEVDPTALDLWNAIGMIEIDKQELLAAHCIFLHVLEENPKSVGGWAGLGRVRMLLGHLCTAAKYYTHAIQLAKTETDAVTPKAFLAQLRQFSGYNFEATAINYELMSENPGQEWLADSFKRSYRDTRPYLGVRGGYHEENEWSDLLDQFIIRYQIYGARANAILPMDNCHTLLFDASDQYYTLKETVSEGNDLYSFNIVRAHAGFISNLNDYYTIEGKLGFSHYSPTKSTTFEGAANTLFEPSFNILYNTPNETALLGFDSETNLVARNFVTSQSQIVGRYFVVGRYARDIDKDFSAGVEATGSVYNDYVRNSSQNASTWLQVTPSTLHDYLSVKYTFGYGGFKKVIPDYFTYKYRFLNELELSLQKNWGQYLYSSLRYLHGWEMRKTRFAQIIVTPPFLINQPFFIERTQYDTLSLNLDYNNNRWRAAAEAFYFRNTSKYTIWAVHLTLGGYF